NEPSAAEIKPLVTRAAQSVPLPTDWGWRPRTGGYGTGGAVSHAVGFHSMRGKSEVKQPFPGSASCRIAVCQSAWVVAICGVAPAGAVCCGSDELSGSGTSHAATDSASADRLTNTTVSRVGSLTQPPWQWIARC